MAEKMNEIHNNPFDLASISNPDFIKKQFPKYKKPHDCSAHLKTAINEFRNLSVYKRECVVEGELYDMINLEGTMSVGYKGNTYNIPMRVMLMEDYPASAPLIYVTPTSNMIFGKNVPYVNSRGKIYTQYLENWEREYHPDLYKILHQLCVMFANNPPVWTKRTNEMVQAIESRSSQRLRNFRLREPRQARPSNDPLGPTGSSTSESTPSALGTSSVLPKSVPKNSTDGPAQNSTRYRSVAYQSQSSSGSSSATPSPSPSPSSQASLGDDRFIPFDPAQAVSSPGSFIPADSYNANSTTDTATVHAQPASTSTDGGHFLRSQSVPSDLSRQNSSLVLATYKRDKLIGSGGFAKVYLYISETTGEKVACKIVDLGANDKDVRKCADALKKEIEILSCLQHTFIISYLSTEEYKNNLAMIMKYFPKGSLNSEIQRQPEGHFDEPTTRFFTWQIIQGVKYLHENGVIHKDIKARNILIDDSNIIKIADFGISKKMDALVTATTTSKDNFASLYWQSPECLGGKKYGRRTDVWSIGCTVVEMLVGNPPLLCDGITKEAAGMKILNGRVYPPEDCSEIAKEFLQLCFRLVDTRPTASELMQKTEFPSRSA